jgi:hypothetical protein
MTRLHSLKCIKTNLISERQYKMRFPIVSCRSHRCLLVPSAATVRVRLHHQVRHHRDPRAEGGGEREGTDKRDKVGR